MSKFVNYLCIFILSILLNIAIIYFVKNYIFKKVNINDSNNNNNENNNLSINKNEKYNLSFDFIFKETILFLVKIFSFDYFITDYMKKKINNDGNKQAENRKQFIQKCNHANFIISSFFMLIILLCNLIFYLIILYQKNDLSSILFWFKKFMFSLVFIRFISRAFELIASFILDLFDNVKQSSLLYKDRIKLSVYSLIEIVILSFALYLTLDIEICKSFSYAIDPIFSQFVSFNNDKKDYLIHICQVIEGMSIYSLITLYFTSMLDKINEKIKIKKNDENNEK